MINEYRLLEDLFANKLSPDELLGGQFPNEKVKELVGDEPVYLDEYMIENVARAAEENTREEEAKSFQKKVTYRICGDTLNELNQTGLTIKRNDPHGVTFSESLSAGTHHFVPAW